MKKKNKFFMVSGFAAVFFILLIFSVFAFEAARAGKSSCANQKCQIDEVWKLMQEKLRVNNGEAGKGTWLGGKVWDANDNSWKSFDEVYPPASVTSGTSTTSLTPSLSGAIIDPLINTDLTRKLYTREFLEKVEEISYELHFNPVHLLAIMRFETGENFKSDQKSKTSKAVGLIQFLPSTAEELGTTVEELSKMTKIEQLDYVKKYFQKKSGIRQNNFGDVAMAVIWPKAIGEEDNFILFRSDSVAYTANSQLDTDNNGAITRLEYINAVKRTSTYDFNQNSFFVPSLSGVSIPAKKEGGTDSHDIKSSLEQIGFKITTEVTAKGTTALLDALR